MRALQRYDIGDPLSRGIGGFSILYRKGARLGAPASALTREHANRGEHLLFACSRRIPASPLEAVLNRRILACSGERTTTARVPGAGGCIVLFLLRPLNAGRRLFPRKRHADGFGTFAIKSTEKAATMSRVFCTFFPQKVLIAVCDWCCLPLFGRRLTAVFARGVLCTFWPQKVVKPRSSPAGCSYLLMAKGSTKTIRMSFSAGVFSGPR
jgi:hypothetical protein